MKKIISFCMVCLILTVYPLYNFVFISSGYDSVSAETQEGVSVVDKFAQADVQTAEKNVKISEEKRNLLHGGNKKGVTATLKAIDSGKLTYRKLFKDVYIVGDSLMNGLEIYNILNANNLITQVSASLNHLSSNIDKIVGMNPPVLILHYGINMIGTAKAHQTNFISSYSKLIKQLKKKLPDTRIIVSGLFPVDTSVAVAPRFKNISKYNKALKTMCKDLKVEFLDSTSVLKAHPECYGVDGIHLSKNFYSKYWLRFIVKEMGIVK